MSCDVVVVGGGPAGTSAAITLARAGRRVVLVDKATFPRDKCCGDGLTTLALRELETLGLVPDDVEGWQHVARAVLRSPSGREVRIELPSTGTYAAVAPRRSLDDSLLRLARAAGVDVRDGHSFVALDERSERIECHVDGPAGRVVVTSRYLVAADGMWSPVRKSVTPGAERYLGEWHGARQYVRDVTGPAATELYVWFEPDLVPGYAWSFPLPDGRANVGFGVLRSSERRGRDLKEMWAGLLTRPHIAAALGPDATADDRYLAWPIPARIDEVDLAVGRVLFAGDAAAATDVMTGEGIGQALLTGRLAADAIVAAGALDPASARAHYSTAVADHLFADHAMSRALNKVLATSWGARGALRVVAASGPWGRRNFGRWMFEDEPRAVMLTPRRWHRRLLARPGAFAPSSG